MRKLMGWYVWFKNSKGAAAVEYALVIALVALAIVAALGVLSGAISDLIDRVKDELDAVVI